MKKFFLFTNLFFLCLVMGFSAHATDVGGVILEDTTWTKAGSPYVVISHVTVIEDVTLTIESGVTVKFDKDKALLIDGTLVAQGTDAEKIIFTSNGDQVAGYWGFISFSDTSENATFDPSGNYTGGCIIQHAEIQYGGSGKPVVTINLSSPFIADSLIANNSGTGISITKGSPIISNCEVRNNSGNGIYSGGDGSTTLTVKNTKALDNSSTGIYSENNGDVSLQNCTVSGNKGGIYLKGDATISDCAISGNSGVSSGGGINASGTLTIQNSTISGNAASAGGGINASGTLTIQNSTISGNVAKAGRGGGIAFYSGTLTIQNSTISGNAAYPGNSGGIYASGTLTIQNSTISGNSADDGGGGIYASGTLIIQNSTISGNSGVSSGGGIYASGTITIEGNTFTDNSANSMGGAISASGTVTIKNNVFKKDKTGNSAPVGGAILASGTVTMQGNTIIQNTASTPFGGVVRLEVSADSIIGGDSCEYANVIKDNTGDGVYIKGNPAFNHNDVYNNTGFSLVCGNAADAPDIDATNNYWGSDKEAVVKAVIWDGLDDPGLGLVNYNPFLTEPCEPGVGTINGHVTNLTGNPIEFAIVIAINIETKEKTWDVTDADGYYEIQELPPGMYLLIVIKKDYKPGIAKVEVEAGVTTTKDFKLRPKSVEDDEDEFTDLYANYPNPFNPDTWIPYYLSQDADVTIRIYNSAGQLVRTLDLGQQVAGIYMDKDKAAYWDGKDDLGQQVASGIYYYTLRAGDFSATRKMVIIK